MIKWVVMRVYFGGVFNDLFCESGWLIHKAVEWNVHNCTLPKTNSSPFQTGFFCPQNCPNTPFLQVHFGCWFLRSISDVSVSKFSSRLRGFFGLATHIGGGKKTCVSNSFLSSPRTLGKMISNLTCAYFFKRGWWTSTTNYIDVCFMFFTCVFFFRVLFFHVGNLPNL